MYSLRRKETDLNGEDESILNAAADSLTLLWRKEKPPLVSVVSSVSVPPLMASEGGGAQRPRERDAGTCAPVPASIANQQRPPLVPIFPQQLASFNLANNNRPPLPPNKRSRIDEKSNESIDMKAIDRSSSSSSPSSCSTSSVSSSDDTKQHSSHGGVFSLRNVNVSPNSTLIISSLVSGFSQQSPSSSDDEGVFHMLEKATGKDVNRLVWNI